MYDCIIEKHDIVEHISRAPDQWFEHTEFLSDINTPTPILKNTQNIPPSLDTMEMESVITEISRKRKLEFNDNDTNKKFIKIYK